MIKRLCWVVLALGLSACSSTNLIKPLPHNSEHLWRAHLKQLSGLTDWRIKARIGVISEKDSGNASLFWEQHKQNYSIRIVAPLGKNILSINGDHNGVSMQGEDGQLITAESAEELIWQNTGWFIPVEGMVSWTLGKPDERMKNDYSLDEAGHLRTLQTSGWDIEYLSYQHSHGIALPKKIRMQNKQLTIKLIVRDWELL